MKKSLVAIAFLSIGFGLLLTTGSYATAPIAGSIPDFRTLPGENVSSITDLDHWTVDFDDKSFIGDEDLDWNITVNGSAAAASKDTANVLSLDASTRVAGDLGSYTFDVQDPTGQAGLSVVSQYQASTDIGMYPALSNDGLLQPTTDAVYTYILEPLGGSGAVTTSLSGSVKLVGAGSASWESVYINDAADRSTLASGTGSASVTGLDATITTGGDFGFASTGALTMPVIVGMKGIFGGNADDWTGVSALVSNAILAASQTQLEIDPAYDTTDQFETAALGNITRIGFAGLGMSPNRVPGTALSTWVMNVNQSNAASLGGGYPSAVVVANSSLPADLQAGGTGFPGAASGQALEISLDGAGGAYAAWIDWNSKVMVDPGYVYAVEASVASTAATAAEAPQINLAIATAGFSNATVIQYGPDTATTSTNSMPIAGEGWIKIRAFIEPTAEDLADVATNGGIYPIIIALNKGAAAHANPVKVYVDNVRVYKTVAPDDLQFGGAKVAAIPSRAEVTVGSRQPMYVNPDLTNPLAGLPIYGNFENGAGAVQDNSVTTGANANGWVLSGGANPGITASIVATAVPATRIEAGDQNWLEFSFSGTQALGSSIVQTRQMTPSSTSGVLWTPGVYVLSADLQTPTGQTSKPQVYITITDNGFQTFGYSVMRQTTDGAIRRIRVPVTFRDVDIFQILLGGVDPTGASVTGTAHLDNVMLDLIDDQQVYTDQSLFQP